MAIGRPDGAYRPFSATLTGLSDCLSPDAIAFDDNRVRYLLSSPLATVTSPVDQQRRQSRDRVFQLRIPHLNFIWTDIWFAVVSGLRSRPYTMTRRSLLPAESNEAVRGTSSVLPGELSQGPRRVRTRRPAARLLGDLS